MSTLQLAAPTRFDADSNGTTMSPDEHDVIGNYDAAHRYERVRGVVLANAAPGPGERKLACSRYE